MALFGIQLIVTMIMLSLLHRFSVHYSFARWLLSYGLVRFLHPTDKQLMKSAGISEKSKDHRNNKKRESSKHGDFYLPRNAQIVLETTRIDGIDLMSLHYYKEYEWLLDFSICAFMVYFISEIYYFYLPKTWEFNLSIIWCLLVIAFASKILFSLTAHYFRGDESIGERSLCIVSGSLFFLTAMIVLVADENFLEFGLNPAYESFNASVYKLFENHGLLETTKGPSSKLIIKFWLAVWCALIGIFFTFPGLRFAQMHKDCLSSSKGKPFIKILLHTGFISPLLIILLWIKPVGRIYFTQKVWPRRGGALMTSDKFDTARILVIILVIFLRFALIRLYLQAYLNLAPKKLQKLSKQSGKIKNTDVKKMVAHVFYYLCVVALQYVGPILIILFTTFLMKTLGNYSWNSSNENTTYHVSKDQKFTLNELSSLFNPIVFRGLLGFMNWWLIAVWFSTTAIGFVYHSYFS